MHALEAGTPRLAHDEADGCLIVGDGIGVGHRADRGEAAGGGGARTARDGLFVFVARLAQMDVQVDETGRDDLPLHIADADSIGGGEPASHCGDLPILNEHIGKLIQITTRIDHAPTLQQYGPAHSLPPPAPPPPPPPRFATTPGPARASACRYTTRTPTAEPLISRTPGTTRGLSAPRI